MAEGAAVGENRGQMIEVRRRNLWAFNTLGQQFLSAETRQAIASYDVSVTINELVRALERANFDEAMSTLKGMSASDLSMASGSVELAGLIEVPGLPLVHYTEPTGISPYPTPGDRGIRPIGIADLHLVRETLLKYELGEIAHVENVLKTEHKERNNLWFQETEQVLTVETETTEESERDLQSTDRSELSRESQSVIADSEKTQAGVSVTASYGAVSVSTHADYAQDHTSTETVRDAASYAKSVSDRAVQRVVKRHRQETKITKKEHSEDRNVHGFDNRNGTEHVIGVYRWLQKVYKARLVNYGKRLMLEFWLPEPSSYFLYSRTSVTGPKKVRRKPEPPLSKGKPLQADDVTESNYLEYASKIRSHKHTIVSLRSNYHGGSSRPNYPNYE